MPTVAGLLLFGRDPQRWIPDARISAVRFDGTSMSGEFADRKEIGGTLLQQLDHAITFLPAPEGVSGFERAPRGVPEVVLREALVNALAHRDYRAASQVRLFVFADRIEIINPGLLLNDLTLDSVRLGGISVRRNPVLASHLLRAGRSESLGMGVPELIAHMRKLGFPEPAFSLEGGHFRMVLRASSAGSAVIDPKTRMMPSAEPNAERTSKLRRRRQERRPRTVRTAYLGETDERSLGTIKA